MKDSGEAEAFGSSSSRFGAESFPPRNLHQRALWSFRRLGKCITQCIGNSDLLLLAHLRVERQQNCVILRGL